MNTEFEKMISIMQKHADKKKININFNQQAKDIINVYAENRVGITTKFLETFFLAFFAKHNQFKWIFGNEITKYLSLSKEAAIKHQYSKNATFKSLAINTHTYFKNLNDRKHTLKSIKESIFDNKILFENNSMRFSKFYTKNKIGRYSDFQQFYDHMKLGNVAISISPYDFITSSQNTPWKSCYRINGVYHGAVHAYMKDTTTIIAYDKDIRKRNLGRIWIYITPPPSSWIVLGRIYGKMGLHVRDNIRTTLQKKYNEHYNYPQKTIWEVLNTVNMRGDLKSAGSVYIDTYVSSTSRIPDTNNLKLHFVKSIDLMGKETTVPNFKQNNIECFQCGLIDDKHNFLYINKEYICTNCAKKLGYVQCVIEKIFFDKKDMLKLSDNTWIQEKYTNYLGICHKCNSTYLLKNMNITIDKQIICKKCTTKLTQCQYCGMYFNAKQKFSENMCTICHKAQENFPKNFATYKVVYE